MARDAFRPVAPVAVLARRAAPDRGAAPRLHLLPLAAWFGGTGRHQRYVGDQFDVTVAPSLTLLEICRERVAESADRGARLPLLLLDPTGDLPLARLDARAVRPAGGRVLVGSRATVPAWAAQAADADPVHYAGHAEYRRDDPLLGDPAGGRAAHAGRPARRRGAGGSRWRGGALRL